MNNCLKVSGVRLRLNQKLILANINFSCCTGDVIGILGRNGQGKSCLMKIIYGTLTAEKSIQFNDTNYYEAYKFPHLITYLPQFNFIPPGLNFKQVFEDYKIDYQDLINVIPDFKNTLLKNLSGGMKRLLEIYIILKSKSEFSLLDEPYSSLNPIHVDIVQDFIKSELKNKGLIITDHSYPRVLDICSRAYILRNTELLQINDPADLKLFGYVR